jgi:cytochrome c oxidase subunit I+III
MLPLTRCNRATASRSFTPTVAPITAGRAGLIAALAIDTQDWWQAGLRGDASGQGATVYSMLAWHGSVVVAVALSAFYYALRWMRGMAPGPANKTLEALRILFLYATFEGTACLLIPRLVP